MKKIHFVLLIFLAGCAKPESPEFLVFTNATLIDGSGNAPIVNSILVVKGNNIVSVGGDIPANSKVIDLKGKYIIPGLINSHGHVGENLTAYLSTYARYGITTVVSLGGEKADAEPLRAANDTVTTQRARLYIAGEVINGKTPSDASAIVDSNKVMGVDWMKIRVDDNLGTSEKMTPEVYTAVINRSHEVGYKIATHMYYLDDAKKLLEAGSDLMAHSVRDKPVDDEFITLIKQKKACYCPTLTRELSTFVYGSTPDFFSDPFFLKEYDSATIAPLLDPVRQEQIRSSKNAQTYKQQLPVAMANLKALVDNNVPIAFGTDSGIPTRFVGYFEHIEMAMMADAGISPVQILTSATKGAAECMGLKKIGELKPGYYADFVVLDADPLSDIKNTRKINSVWIGGQEVNRVKTSR
jgi:imidazolonepropionase-like amidohydrolase